MQRNADGVNNAVGTNRRPRSNAAARSRSCGATQQLQRQASRGAAARANAKDVAGRTNAITMERKADGATNAVGTDHWRRAARSGAAAHSRPGRRRHRRATSYRTAAVAAEDVAITDDVGAADVQHAKRRRRQRPPPARAPKHGPPRRPSPGPGQPKKNSKQRSVSAVRHSDCARAPRRSVGRSHTSQVPKGSQLSRVAKALDLSAPAVLRAHVTVLHKHAHSPAHAGASCAEGRMPDLPSLCPSPPRNSHMPRPAAGSCR